MAKRPAFLLYTGDWLKDTALRCCSLEARGFWIDMLCHMHDCTPYGYLKVNNKVIHMSNLASLVGVNLDDAKRLIKELIDAGVCQQLDDGTYYSKRMVKDEEIRIKRASGGHLGGNPKLKPKLKKTKKSKGYPYLESESVNEDESLFEIIYPFQSENFINIWLEWINYKKTQHKFTYKNKKYEQAALKELSEISKGNEQNAILIIQKSIANGYKGLFELKNNTNGQTTTKTGNQIAAERLAAKHGGFGNNGK